MKSAGRLNNGTLPYEQLCSYHMRQQLSNMNIGNAVILVMIGDDCNMKNCLGIRTPEHEAWCKQCDRPKEWWYHNKQAYDRYDQEGFTYHEYEEKDA